MSNRYIFTIVGAYNHDRTIFDGLQLPAQPFTSDPELFQDFVPMDKDTFINNLLMECGQLSLLYTNTDFFKQELKLWSDMHQIDWSKMYETLFYKYNPIWNKDGRYTETESGETSSESGKTRTLDTLKESEDDGSDVTEYHETGDNTNTTYVNAYNAGTGTERDRNVNEHSEDSARTTNYGKTNSLTETGTIQDEETSSGTSGRSLERIEQGNIGVTTTQQMIKEQREIIFNMYEYIIAQFKERFCLLIW